MKTILKSIIITILFFYINTQSVFPINLNQDSTVVAWIKDGQITIEDVQDVIDSLPDYKKFVPSDLTEIEWKTQIIQDLAARSYLSKEAKQLSLNTTEQFSKFMDQKTHDFSMKALSQNEIESDITVTDEDIIKFYEDHSTLFHMPALVTGRHIFFDLTHADSPERKESIRLLAEEVLKKAQKGEDFSTLANTYSDSRVPDKSRLIGPFAINNSLINVTILTTLYSLEPGQISGLAQTHFGYEILKLEIKIPAWSTSLLTAKKEIKNFLISKIKEKRINDFQENLLKDYHVQIHPENFDADSTAPLVEMTLHKDSAGIVSTPYKITLGDFAKQNDISKIPKENREGLLRKISYMQAIYSELAERKYQNQPKVERQIEEIKNTQLAKLAIENRLDKMQKALKVSDTEIKNFYKTDSPAQENFSILHEQVKVRSIAFALDSADVMKDPVERMFVMDKLKKRADEAYALLIGGKNFADVAREYSTDTNDSTGRETDYFDMDAYPKIPFDHLQVGKISQPVEAANGYLIVKLVGRRKLPIKSLKERKDWIEKFLRDNKLNKAREDILSAAIQKEELRINTSVLGNDIFDEIRNNCSLK